MESTLVNAVFNCPLNGICCPGGNLVVVCEACNCLAALFGCGIAVCISVEDGAAECTINQWVSDYIESSLGIPTLWGDILGMAMFALLLGVGRTAYSKRGKNIVRVMLLGMIGAAICYVIAAVSPNPAVGLVACVITGFCVSILPLGFYARVGGYPLDYFAVRHCISHVLEKRFFKNGLTLGKVDGIINEKVYLWEV